MPTTFLTARWHRLAIINYEIDPGVLAQRTPYGTEIDTWNGRCFVSVVGFQFLDTRVFGIAVPFHRNFLEVNLRFYVRRHVVNEVRRGVVFVKELVPRRAIAWTANTLYSENYEAVWMSSEDTGDRVTYSWRHGRHEHSLALSVRGASHLPPPDSEECFITEHYWGYARQRDGSTLEYQVEHPQWRVWHGFDPALRCDVAAIYGREFAAPLNGTASSCFLAEGSEVVVRKGIPVT